MWGVLWLLPLIFLIWAIVLVVKKVRRSGTDDDGDDEQTAREERIRRAMEESEDL